MAEQAVFALPLQPHFLTHFNDERKREEAMAERKRDSNHRANSKKPNKITTPLVLSEILPQSPAMSEWVNA